MEGMPNPLSPVETGLASLLCGRRRGKPRLYRKSDGLVAGEAGVFMAGRNALRASKDRSHGRAIRLSAVSSKSENYFALGLLSVPLFTASFLLTEKLHMVSLAFKSWLVFPTCFSTSYCSPPGQVLPPPFTLYETTCAPYWQPS